MASFQCYDSPAKPRRFFKIILSDIASHTKLMIPPKYVRKCGKDLGDRIYLNVLNGKDWPVDLERNNGKIWLHNGWLEFARFYSILAGHFLVFEYQGDSSFNVIIFDSSATEIDYLLAGSDSRESIKEMKRETIINDPSAGDVRPIKKTKANAAGDDAILNGENSTPKTKQDKSKGIKILSSSVASEPEKDGVSEANKSENPVFVIKMEPSYVSGSHVGVPKKFITEYITKDRSNVTLQDSDGRVWSVMCLVYDSYAQFSAGWKAFARGNNLVVGDVCDFELINGAEKLLKVVVSRTKS